ncbi:MAG: hypothetical protein JSV91_02225 [Phycisphaerales bacterium]|nr:MAG: hypothetical protein JSV91_02225 [Phycisphaerales bacterium]
MITVLTPLVASALIAASPATGGSFHNDWVSADAQWFAHVDVEGLVGSQLGQFVLGHAEELDIDLSDIEGMKEEIGIDPLTDFSGVTVYSAGYSEEDVVIIVQMNSKIDTLVDMLAMKEPTYELIQTGGYGIHSWQDGGETMYGHVAPGRGEEDRIVTIAHDKTGILRALRVMDDEAPSIDDKEKSALRDEPRDGSFFFATAFDLNHLLGDEEDPASQVVRRAKSFSLDVGEDDEDAFATANITARDREHARNIVDVLNGIVALGRLFAESESAAELPLDEVLDALTVTRERATVIINLEGDPTVPLKFMMGLHEEM